MNKTRISSAVLAALLLSVFLFTAASAATMGVVKMPTSDGSVWLRASASATSPALTYAKHGDLVQILKETKSWDRVTIKSSANSAARGRTGWMYNRYITKLRNPSDITGWGALGHIKTQYAGSTVYLRSGPSTKYAIKDRLSRNDMLIILDKYGSWYEVQVINSLRTGYVHKNYVANGVAGRTTANVNQRKKASTSGKVLQVIPSGSEVTVLNIGKNWSKVKYAGKTGYIYNGYLNMAL